MSSYCPQLAKPGIMAFCSRASIHSLNSRLTELVSQRIPMRQDCPECQRLWRSYATATTAHVGLEKKLRLFAENSAGIEALTRDVATAGIVRETARQAIHQHEGDAHGDVLSAAQRG